VNAAARAFEANVKSFRKYRQEQCGFVFALASVGNGAEDNKRACEAQLDIERVEQLRNAEWWLK
jgi:predicted adenine nucleotide alpha hydrolase (AANH) superfamily ATPase